MTSLKLWVRGIGIVLVLIGFMSFPLGSSVNPERSTSLFYFLVDLGFLAKFGFMLEILGVLLFVVSFFIPNKVGNRN